MPTDFTTSNVDYLIIQVAFVLLMLAGLVTVWSWIRTRLLGPADTFWLLATEALLALPWMFFPLIFGLSLAGLYQPTLILAQLGLAVAGGRWIWRRREAIVPGLKALSRVLRSDLPYAFGLATVALFLVWAWVMPFPESFNGHQHDLINLLRQLWREGEYDLLAPSQVSYDNNILVWPAPFPMFLSLFTVQGFHEVGLRPIFLLPGVVAFLSLQMLRQTGRELGHASAGSLAFLMVAFSYYAASDFTDISFDVLSPLFLTYFGYHAVRWSLRGEGSTFPFLLVLAVSFLIRRQVFLLIATVLLALIVCRLVPWRAFVPRVAGRRGLLAAALVFPALLWSGIAWAQYGSPFFPHDTATTLKIFTPKGAGNDLSDPAVVPGPSGAGGVDVKTTDDSGGPIGKNVDKIKRIATARTGDHNYLLEHYLPVFPEPSNFVKNVFAGLSLSVLVTLGVLAFLLSAGRLPELAQRARRLRLLVAAYLVGSAFVAYAFLELYPKFPHYLGYLIAIFPAVLVVELGRRLPRWAGPSALAAVLLTIGVGYWAINTWGHAPKDSTLANVKFLWPYYKGPLERLQRDSNRPVASLHDESVEYVRAADASGGILYMDHEPGALMPALLDKEFLGRVLYVESPRAAPLRAAHDKLELKSAFDRMDIAYVYRPGRPHPLVDDTLLMRVVRAHKGPSQWVIPVNELLSSSPSGNPSPGSEG